MSQAPSYLRNHEAVLAAFGYWPSFHDAPVIAFKQTAGPESLVELLLHGSELIWEQQGQSARGHFKLVKHHLVRFVFRDLSEVALEGFTPENVLFGLEFSSPEEFEASGRFKVTLESAIGGELSGSFSARAGEVVEVVPCDAEGQRIEPPGTPES